MIQPLRRLLPLALSSALSSAAIGQTVWFVDAAAAPGGDGGSWAGAFDSIEAAFDQALLHDSIWVKAGIYTPTKRQDPGDPLSVTFLLTHGVHLYGGFDGTETDFSERAGLYEQTILTGDVGVAGDPADNAYRVVRLPNLGVPPPGATTLDGFTIRDGRADGFRQGGGVESINGLLLLGNCTVRDNVAWKGAGLSGTPGIAAVRCCRFIDNVATSQGGAIWGQVITYKVSNCVFRGNRAEKGGAVFLTQSHSVGWRPKNVINNSVLHDNSAVEGGAIFLAGSMYTPGKALIANSTIAFNSAALQGGGIRSNTDLSPIPAIGRLFNCIVWGNTAPFGPNLHGRQAVAYSNIEGGGYLGGGNLSVDPLFVDALGRDLRLLPGSPCNDAGNNDLVREDRADVDFDGDWEEIVQIDLDGRRRFHDDPHAPDVGNGTAPIVDMGAYEN